MHTDRRGLITCEMFGSSLHNIDNEKTTLLSPSPSLFGFKLGWSGKSVNDAIVSGVDEPHAPSDEEYNQSEYHCEPQLDVEQLRIIPTEKWRQIE